MGLGRITKFLILCAVIGACAASAAAQQPILPGILRPERPVSGGGSFAQPPAATAIYNPGNTTVSSFNISVAVTNNALVSMWYSINSSSATQPPTVSGTNDGGWTCPAAASGAGGGIGQTSGICYAIGNASATDVITVNGYGAATNFNIAMVQVNPDSGGTPAADGGASSAQFNNNYFGAAPGTSNVVTTHSGDLLFHNCELTTATGITAGTGWTIEQNSGGNNTAVSEDQIAGAAGSYAVSMNYASGTHAAACGVLAFKP